MHRLVLQELLGEPYEIAAPSDKSTVFIDFDKEIFLWSLVRGQPELNYLFWSRGKNKICQSIVDLFASPFMSIRSGAALIAILLYRRRARKDPNSDFEKIIEQFEKFAAQTLNRFYHENPSLCLQAITRRIPAFGNITWLELAITADAKYFIAQRAVQDVLDRIWYRGKTNLHNMFF